VDISALQVLSFAAMQDASAAMQDAEPLPPENLEKSLHIVLLGDSALDNGRHLNLAKGELSVEKQLLKICALPANKWDMTVLAQDGALIEDVLLRQVPLIPEGATHIVLSASGNDLLSLLNHMVVANFTLRSMYSTIGAGLSEVSDSFRTLVRRICTLGCHLAICTLYRPNFDHFFFKSFATFSLGIHNGRIHQISVETDCSIIDCATIFDTDDDFANPLELSTRGGSKMVENIRAFVNDNPMSNLASPRHYQKSFTDDESFTLGSTSLLGVPTRCCATRTNKRKIYDSKAVSQELIAPDKLLAQSSLSQAMEFSEAQERWSRTPRSQPRGRK